LPQSLIATIGGRYAVAPIPLGERERDALLGSICVHNTFDLEEQYPPTAKVQNFRHTVCIFSLIFYLATSILQKTQIPSLPSLLSVFSSYLYSPHIEMVRLRHFQHSCGNIR
jgi:hypothetical protein